MTKSIVSRLKHGIVDPAPVFLIRRAPRQRDLRQAVGKGWAGPVNLRLLPDQSEAQTVRASGTVSTLHQYELGTQLGWAGQLALDSDVPGEPRWFCAGWDYARRLGTLWIVSGPQAVFGPRGLVRGCAWGAAFFGPADVPGQIWLTEREVQQQLAPFALQTIGDVIWQFAWQHGREHPQDVRTRVSPDGVRYVDWRSLVDFISANHSVDSFTMGCYDYAPGIIQAPKPRVAA